MVDRLGRLFFYLAVLIYSVTPGATLKDTRPSKTRDDVVEISNKDEALKLIDDDPQVLQRRFLPFFGFGGASKSNDDTDPSLFSFAGLRKKLTGSVSWISNPFKASGRKPPIISGDGSKKRLNSQRISFNNDGIRFRLISPNVMTVAVRGNNVYLNNKVVCDDISKLTDTLSYRKTGDGISWHTNLNLGKQMTQPEIEAFEKAWSH